MVARRKDWDSDFFGYEVWEIRQENCPGKRLKEQLDELKTINTRLVYLFSKEECQAALESGGMLVDKKILFEKALNGNPLTDERIISLPSGNIDQDLIKLALSSGEYSRFRIDPCFKNREFERLYMQWINGSVNRSIADEVLVYEEDNRILGIVTLALKNDSVWIGLIAVAEGQRGKNIGSKLIEAAEAFGIRNNCLKLDVFTQQDNHIACQFYQKNGYTAASLDYIYHIWLTV